MSNSCCSSHGTLRSSRVLYHPHPPPPIILSLSSLSPQSAHSNQLPPPYCGPLQFLSITFLLLVFSPPTDYNALLAPALPGPPPSLASAHSTSSSLHSALFICLRLLKSPSPLLDHNTFSFWVQSSYEKSSLIFMAGSCITC